jgi:histidine ammonia-lyase
LETLLLDGTSLAVNDVLHVAEGQHVGLAPETYPLMKRSRRAVERLLEEGQIAYGITTGFGHFKDKLIPSDQVGQLQTNLVRSHAAGVGPLLSEEIVRGMLLVRANTLAKGFSGVRPVVVERLVDCLNHGIHPCVPCQGSLGASGDLAPLAHLSLVLLGEGEAMYQGQKMSGKEALDAAGLAPLQLQAKEGLALLNGTTMMVSSGALMVRRAINLVLTADIAACLSLEALHGTDKAYDARVHAVRPHPRQIDCAAFLRQLVDGSSFLRKNDPFNVQDPYTLRCVPQVHGAVRDAIAYAQWVINIELNAVNDNPIIFVDDDENIDVISAGNFHGEPIAMAMDYMKLALTDLGNMSERRVARLVDADSNGGVLPMFLTENGGVNSGFMIAQYTAASLASANKPLAHPASADSIPSSANTEDHVSMGATSALFMQQVLRQSETIVAIELMSAAQGVDFRMKQMGLTAKDLGPGTRVAYECIREKVPFLAEDDVMSGWMEEVRKLVAEGTIKERVEEVCEGLSKSMSDRP